MTAEFEDAEYRAMALMLRLITQTLIKVHAGSQWGLLEPDIMSLTKEAEALAKALERR